MGCFPQMEELVGTRNPHASNDFLLLLHRLPGPDSAHDNRKYDLSYLKKAIFYFVLREEDVEKELCCRFYAACFCCSPLGNLKASFCAEINIFFPPEAAACSFICLYHALWCFSLPRSSVFRSSASKRSSPSATAFTIPMICPGSGH